MRYLLCVLLILSFNEANAAGKFARFCKAFSDRITAAVRKTTQQSRSMPGAEVSKALSWRDSSVSIDGAFRRLSSVSPSEQAAGIAELGSLRIDINSLRGEDPGTYNTKMLDVVDRLTGFARRSGDAALRVQAMEAAVQYAKANSGGWKNGYLGRRAPEVLDDVYSNYELPDNVRKIAYDAASEAYRANGFKERAAFKTSAELRQKDVIPFLGKTNKELNSNQRSIASKVLNAFSKKSASEQRAIYEQWLALGQVPSQHKAEYVEGYDFDNYNYLLSLPDNGTDSFEHQIYNEEEVFKDKITGATIKVRTNRGSGGRRLRSFTDAEKAAIKKTILEGGSIDLGNVMAQN